MNSLLTLLMLDDIANSNLRGGKDNRGGGIGCLPMILGFLALILFAKIIGYIESNLAEFFFYFVGLSVVFTVSIPVIGGSNQAFDKIFIVAIRILNIIVGFLVVWLLVVRLGSPLVTPIAEYLRQEMVKAFPDSFFLRLIYVAIVVITKSIAFALDMFFIPLCTIPLIQIAIYRIMGIRERVYLTK